jgi:hypothetical protein
VVDLIDLEIHRCNASVRRSRNTRERDRPL